MKIYRAAQVAQKLGISKQTMLRYEKRGIFPRSRRNHINLWREYTDEDIIKMKQVLAKGFTVVEMVMVLVIIGILAAVTIPRFQTFYSYRLSGAAKKLITDIRYTQQVAIARHANTALNFSAANDTYAAFEEYPQGSGTWQYIRDPFTQANLSINYRTDPQYRGIDVVNPNFNNTAILQFDWRGAPRYGGNVTLQNQEGSTTIYVQNNTGKVRAQ